ncbi:MAG: ATP synthase F1 subunit gamma [Deltaproteobacteria bacterium]|nr:ATP synthase F1 subunit gamma [Deltaproteobacteria bacterium]
MATLRAIRKRISSVKGTEQITKAMKMVSAAKLRRAQAAIENARPYAKKIHDVVSDLAQGVEPSIHPLLRTREPKRIGVLVITSDRGLCGGFNTNLNKKAENFIKENKERYEEIILYTVGKKVYRFLSKQGYNVDPSFTEILGSLSYQDAKNITKVVIEGYIGNSLDAFFMIYHEFKSALVQRIVVEDLLPIRPEEKTIAEGESDYIFEPGKRELLSELLPKYIETEIWRALLESSASEHGARMTAMENATKNANEMIDNLTLKMNRARQESITKELLDIVGGAEALKD